jgi:hypothetical protein
MFGQTLSWRREKVQSCMTAGYLLTDSSDVNLLRELLPDLVQKSLVKTVWRRFSPAAVKSDRRDEKPLRLDFQYISTGILALAGQEGSVLLFPDLYGSQ